MTMAILPLIKLLDKISPYDLCSTKYQFLHIVTMTSSLQPHSQPALPCNLPRLLLPGRNLADVPPYLFDVLDSVLKFLCLSSFDLAVCLIENTLRQTLGHPWRVGKSSLGTSNRFVGLTSKFNTTIEINPPYPQVAKLRTWIKTIETKLVAYKMKSTTPIGSIMLIPFEDEVISVANIQAQPPGQVFNVEAELSLAKINVLTNHYFFNSFIDYQNICQFEVTIKDNNGFATTIVSDEIAEKMLHLTSEEIYEICFIKLEHFCCGSRNGHFLHSFAAATECRVLQASDVAMWMPYVPLLLWKLKIFSPVIADKTCVIVSSHAIAQPLFHHCSGRDECHTVIPSDASFQFCLLSLKKKYELPISA
ncbi:hypothetical protein MTR67_038097 [Solanum verrucosum]|uniref:Uncharacterized protein n=1 Tax=Solanum verrucosum TaxID=315347 RepID=A0AAF0UEX2_SOLVR|nr:hypothetical protein MTR67_038097 [Solanum verrucosum]